MILEFVFSVSVWLSESSFLLESLYWPVLTIQISL